MLRQNVKAGCLALCVSTAICAQQASAAEWRVAPSAYVGSSFTDNPRLLPNGGESATGAVGEFSASLQRLTPRSDLSLTPRLRSARYSDDETLDSDDQYFNTKYRWLNERSEWSGEVGLTRDTTLTSELGLTGLVQSNRRHEAIMVSAGPNFLLTERVTAGAQLYWLDNHYLDAEFTGLVDYGYRALSLFSAFAVTDRSSLTMTAQGGELTSEGFGGNTRDGSLKITWAYQLYDLWSLTAAGGPSYVESDFGSDSGALYEVALKRQADRWSVASSVGRSLSPTGRGVLTRRDRMSLSFNRRLTERLSATVSAAWFRNEDLLSQPGINTYQVEYGRLDISGHWRVAQHWSLALQLTGSTQDYDYELAPQRAESYRASLSMVWNGQPQPL